MEIYQAKNVEEAIELAYRYKNEGRYNWFRGQITDWPPVSSLARVYRSGNSQDIERAIRRFVMFFDWLGTIPELRYLQAPERTNDSMAIMQHYGIPTNYIDFTTDPGVAGFFAVDAKNPQPDTNACIYCLNVEDLMDVFEMAKSSEKQKDAVIEPIKIDVRNLWRLQAQSGVFLYANCNWEIVYPMDRIVFPHSGYPSYPTRERIYPAHKSPLEEKLDQCFYYEAEVFFPEYVERFAQSIHRQVQETVWDGWQNSYSPTAFPDASQMIPLESWNPESLKAWEVDRDEGFFQTVGWTINLNPRPSTTPDEFRNSITFGVKQVLRSEPSIREKEIDWAFTTLPETLSARDLNNAFRLLWNGMRRLPYSETEIADAFGSTVILLLAGFPRAGKYSQQEIFSTYFGECIQVEFGVLGGGSSRGWVTKQSLQDALRFDMLELLSPEYKESAQDVRKLLWFVYNPRLMFEFSNFKTMFARESIPVQVASGREFIVFNPARLKTFGLP